MPTWRRLSHENVLPFRGVNMTHFQLALVYDWGENGNINQYTASHPHASRASLVGNTLVTAATAELLNFLYLRQLLDVAKGLEYLHSLNVPHGDLKGVRFLSLGFSLSHRTEIPSSSARGYVITPIPW